MHKVTKGPRDDGCYTNVIIGLMALFGDKAFTFLQMSQVNGSDVEIECNVWMLWGKRTRKYEEIMKHVWFFSSSEVNKLIFSRSFNIIDYVLNYAVRWYQSSSKSINHVGTATHFLSIWGPFTNDVQQSRSCLQLQTNYRDNFLVDVICEQHLKSIILPIYVKKKYLTHSSVT